MVDKSPKNALRRATLAFSVMVGAVSPLALDSFLSPAALAQSARVDISIFFDELAPHGRWVQSQRHGFVFLPASIDADWRPYTLGRWVNTDDFGWYWVSDEPFGWATYHYGRWGYDSSYGWFWVPGSTWAPAWVSWRSSDDHIGWAPLPPPNRGYAFAATVGPIDVGVGGWCFVRETDFLAPSLTTVIIERRRNPEIFRVAQPLGAVRVVNNVVVNTVVTVQRIERATNRQVVVHRINDRDRPGRAEVNQTTISAYRPTLATSQPRQRPNNVGRADQLANSPRAADAGADARGREQGRRARQESDTPATKRGDPAVGSGETGRQAEPKGTKSEPRDDDRSRQAEPKGSKGDDRDGDRARQATPKGGKGGDRDDGAAARQAEPKGGKNEPRDSGPARQAEPRERGPARAGPGSDGDDGRATKGAGRGGGAGGSQGAGGRPETPPAAGRRDGGGPNIDTPSRRGGGDAGPPSRGGRQDGGPPGAARGDGGGPGMTGPSGRGGGAGGGQGAGGGRESGPPAAAGRGDGGGPAAGGSAAGGRGPSGPPPAARGDGPGAGAPGGRGGGPGGGGGRPER